MPAADDDRLPEQILYDIIARCASFILSPRHIATVRLIMAEYTHSPELSRIFHQRPAAVGKDRLELYLGELSAQGMITISTPKEAASMVLGLAIGEFLIGVLLGFRALPTAEEVESRIRSAVRVFLRGSRPEGE